MSLSTSLSTKKLTIYQWMDSKETWVWGVVFLTALLYLWPNLVHEPIHYMTLHAFGGEGFITFDWLHWPAEPFMTHSFIPGVVSGVLYRIMPSLLSVAILSILFLTRSKPALLTHIAFPLYLTFDLVVNIIGQTTKGNDFYFLTVLNPLFTLIPLCLILFLGGLTMYAGIIDESKEYYSARCNA